jgi:hypothetical protein
MRGGSGRRGELGGELPEAAVRAALLDQGKHCQVPEQGGSTVAQDHFVPVRQAEEFGQPIAD